MFFQKKILSFFFFDNETANYTISNMCQARRLGDYITCLRKG